MSRHTSQYDPTRETVGAIYREAQLTNTIERIENGDMTNCMMKSMVDDLNHAIEQGNKDFEGKEFYITVHEKKDLQMPSCLLRRMIKTPYRPWPEDDTLVFFVHPSSGDVRFCWCLPHVSEMDNIINNEFLFDRDYVNHIKAWKKFDLHCFGFVKLPDGSNWIPNDKWIDDKLEAPKSSLVLSIHH